MKRSLKSLLYNKRVTVRLTDKQFELLQAFARMYKVNESEAIRLIVSSCLEN